MSKKEILITGGAGFIGSHLSEFLLGRGYNITIIDNFSTGRLANVKHILKRVKFINADISKYGNWEKNFKNVKYVFHLAALADIVPSIQNPSLYFNANVVGTKNVMNACIKYNVKNLVYSASSSCYGVPKKFPTDEDEIINPKYPYALTKRMGEEIVLHYGEIYKIKVNSLRLFNVYGTRSRTSGTYGAMFGVFLAQKIKNKPLTVVGDGKQKRDFTYVSDIVNAFYKCIKYKGNIKIFNVGTGKPVSVNRIVNLLKCEKVNIPKRPGEPDQTNANITKIKKELKWKPTVTIEQGIKMLIDEIGYWRKAPLWTPKKIKLATKDWFKYLK
jgi:UDP-glucose 4-epimerase